VADYADDPAGYDGGHAVAKRNHSERCGADDRHSGFHRDDELLPFAHQFAPDIWLDGRAQQYPQLVPFSAGPAECPGRNLVLFVTSTLLAHMLSALRFELTSTPQPVPDEPLPMTLNQLTLDFAVQAHRARDRVLARYT
jgi:hypothetical protein